MSQADIEAFISASATARAAGDYQTALDNLQAARDLIESTPDIERGQDSVKYRPGALNKSIEELQRRVNSASGIQSASIRWKEPSA